MAVRGIQIIGLLVSTASLIGILLLRRGNRLTSRSYVFWVCFWTVFTIVDIFPSMTGYITPYFDLGRNMYTLTAISVMTLFIFVFGLFSYINELHWKINEMVRDNALVDWRTNHQEEWTRDER